MSKIYSYKKLLPVVIIVISFILSGSCKKETDLPSGKNDEEVIQTPWEFNTPWPFDQPPVSSLRASEKKVFAHYFTQFPISIDNKQSDIDYYSKEYLTPGGESNKHESYGGYLRSRPLPRSPQSEDNWMELDMQEEVRRAVFLGLDGFACDLLSHQGYHFERVIMLLEAAAEIDPEFKIVLMPDMEAFKDKTDKIADVVKTLSNYPAAYRLNDGRLVVAPYNAQNQSAEWWKNWLSQMQTDGIDIAFFPVFQGWKNHAEAFAGISYGMSDWGWRSVSTQSSWVNVPGEAKSYGPLWMTPVCPQDMRPRNQRYWEAGNSGQYRVMWENAINGGADWVQLITWNDYAEHTVIAPSTGSQYAFYDLTAYYVTWFKTGVKPVIKRDVLYYFYRNHSTLVHPQKQTKLFMVDNGSDSPSNQIEVLAFLTSSGILEIEISGTKKRMDAQAGMNVFNIPIKAGRPVFRLIRNNETEITLPGAFSIKDEIDYQNMMYFGGSNSRLPVSEL